MEITLKHFLLFSAAVHAAGLSLAGFRFDRGSCRPQAQPALRVFPGRLLFPPQNGKFAGPAKPLTVGEREGFIRGPGKDFRFRHFLAQKPAKPAAVPPSLARECSIAFPAAPGDLNREKDSVVMIHPLLPYQLQLYFKDRQSVHLELAFKIISSGHKNYVIVKRKISSGNLEADLLCCRYLGHYLFIQQAKFVPGTWQTVKIDLSKENTY